MSTWTVLGKRKIGQQLFFPDGIGTNYSQNTAPQSISFPPSAPADRYSSSGNAAQPSRSTSEPFRDTENLPPRLRRRKNCQRNDSDANKNIVVQGKYIFLHHFLPTMTSSILESFLRDIGFSAPVNVAILNKTSATLEFSHSNVATIAFSLIQYRASCLFAEPSSAHSERAVRPPEKEVIDLTETDNSLASSGERSSGGFLQDLSQDLAEDTSDDSMSEYNADITVAYEGNQSLHTSISQDVYDIENSDIDVHLTKTFELPQYKRNANASVADFAGPHKVHHRSTIPIVEARHPVSPQMSSTRPQGDGAFVHVVRLPPAAYNRARRVLLPRNQNFPMMTISMKADVQFFDRTARHRISRYSIPNNCADLRHATDAVMIGDTAVIGYKNSVCQVSLIQSSEGHSPMLTELKHRPHREQSKDSGSKNGVNCLAAKKTKKNAIQFFTGGYDRTIMLWSVTTTPDLETETERLTTLPTIPNALAFKDRILLVGTSKKILTLDLGHLSAKPITAQVNNLIHQIHVHKQAPNVTILEMDSLDLQIQIFDDRVQRGFDRASDCSFGVRVSGRRS